MVLCLLMILSYIIHGHILLYVECQGSLPVIVLAFVQAQTVFLLYDWEQVMSVITSFLF